MFKGNGYIGSLLFIWEEGNMSILAKEVILNEAAAAKNGTFIRIGYRTELPVKAAYKKQGIQFFKYTEMSVRLGVNYGHIASVIARKAEQQLVETIQRTNNYEWVIHNKVRHNTATGKDYLYVANFNQGSNIHNVYVGIKDGEVFNIVPEDKEMFKILNEEYMIPSYWNGTSNAPEIMNISFDNIHRIDKSGITLDDIVGRYVEEFEARA